MGSNSFPFLSLSSDDQVRVFKRMDLMNIIGFSLLSKRSKDLVKSLKLKIRSVSVQIGQAIVINIEIQKGLHYLFQLALYFYTAGNSNNANYGNELINLGTPISVRAVRVRGRETQEWERNGLGFTLRNWIDHFLIILNRTYIDHIAFRNQVTQIDIGSLETTIKGLQARNLLLEYGNRFNYSEMILEAIHSNKVELRGRPYNNPNWFARLLAQYNDLLEFHEPSHLALNDVLTCNSLGLYFYDSENLFVEDLNRFLKHWINGSNFRLKYLIIGLNTAVPEDVIFEGVNYQIAPENQMRNFPVEISMTSIIHLKGGFDIQRDDETCATVLLQQNPSTDTSYFQFVVWD